MAKNYKPRAYLKKVECGYFMLDVVTEWRAYNDYYNLVAWGKTRKECEKMCRSEGYVPESY